MTFGGEPDITAACKSLFQGFLQKTEQSGLSGCGKDHCHRRNVCCSQAGSSGWKTIAMEMF